MKECIIIYNPNSGTLKNQSVLDNLNNTLEKNGYTPELIKTEYKGHATEIMTKLKLVDLVICAGGDGTLNEVVTGNCLRKNKLLLAYLPFGTCNDVGTMYGYTKNYLKDVDLILNGTIKKVDVCRINKHPFVYVACFGDFVNISYTTPRELKIKYGRLAYIFYGMGKINSPLQTYKFKYVINGEEKEGNYSFIFVSNSSRIGGVDNLYKDVKLDDNMFEVAFCKAQTKAELIQVAFQLLRQEIKDIDAFEYYKTNNLHIEFDKVVPSWGIDGEEYLHNTNTFDFTISKDMEMLVPNEKIDKLFN